MTEKDLRSALHDEASSIDVPAAPAAAIIAGGRSRRRARHLTTGGGAVALLAVVGVGITVLPDEQADDAGPTGRADHARCDPDARIDVDGSVLRGPGGYDYDMQPTVGDAVAASDSAVTGRILSWTEGEVVTDGTVTQSFALLAVDVDEASGDQEAGDVAYFKVSRGISLSPGDPDGESTRQSIDDLAAAAPPCARVILLANESETVEPSGATIRTPQGVLPTGTSVSTPLIQGFILETASGGFDSGIADPVDLDGWADRNSSHGFQTLADEVADNPLPTYRDLRAAVLAEDLDAFNDVAVEASWSDLVDYAGGNAIHLENLSAAIRNGEVILPETGQVLRGADAFGGEEITEEELTELGDTIAVESVEDLAVVALADAYDGVADQPRSFVDVILLKIDGTWRFWGMEPRWDDETP